MATRIISTAAPRAAATVHETATQRLTIGMDMVEPFGVYVDGEQVAEYATEAEALVHYQALEAQS